MLNDHEMLLGMNDLFAPEAARFGLQGDPLVHVTKFSAYRSDQNIPCRSVARFAFFRDFPQIGQCFLSSIGHPRLRCRACECSEAPTGIAQSSNVQMESRMKTNPEGWQVASGTISLAFD